MKMLKLWIWDMMQFWPWGYHCDFVWGYQGRIRVTRNWWVIIGGDEKGDSTDALPITFVSPALVERIAEELEKKWYYPGRPEAQYHG